MDSNFSLKQKRDGPPPSAASAGSAFLWYLAPAVTAGNIFTAMLLAVRVMDDFGFALTALLFLSFWWPFLTFVERLANMPNDKLSGAGKDEYEK